MDLSRPQQCSGSHLPVTWLLGEENRKQGGNTACKIDMESVGLNEDDVLDRTQWKNDIHNHSGATRWWEKPEEKKKGCWDPYRTGAQDVYSCEKGQKV